MEACLNGPSSFRQGLDATSTGSRKSPQLDPEKRRSEVAHNAAESARRAFPDANLGPQRGVCARRTPDARCAVGGARTQRKVGHPSCLRLQRTKGRVHTYASEGLGARPFAPESFTFGHRRRSGVRSTRGGVRASDDDWVTDAARASLDVRASRFV